MKKHQLDFNTNAEFAIMLSILTKSRVSFPKRDDLEDCLLVRALKTLSPETQLVYENDTILVIPGAYHSGRHTVIFNDSSIKANNNVFLEPLFILGLFGKEETHLKIKGITNFGEPVDFVSKIHSVILEMFVASKPTISITKRGFPPAGEGSFSITIPTVKELEPITLREVESLEWIDALVVTARVSADFLQRAATVIKKRMEPISKVKITSLVYNRKDSGPSPGVECSIVAGGKRCVFYAISGGESTPEETADSVCSSLLSSLEMGGNIDPKLIPFIFVMMGLARGVSHLYCCKLKIEHWKVLEVLKIFLEVEYKVVEHEDGVIVSIIGSGYLNPYYCI